jgi:hypothetical protein
MPNFSLSFDAPRLAGPLIRADHKHLRSVSIRYSSSDAEPPAGGGCASFGKVKALSDWERHLEGDGDQASGNQLAVVVLSKTWDRLDDAEKRSALSHLFGHVHRDEDHDKLRVVAGHPIELHTGEVGRSGLWTSALKRLAEEVRRAADGEQIPLDLDAAEADGPQGGVEVRYAWLPEGVQLPSLRAGVVARGIACPSCDSLNVVQRRIVVEGVLDDAYRICRECGTTFRLALPEPEVLALTGGTSSDPYPSQPHPDGLAEPWGPCPGCGNDPAAWDRVYDDDGEPTDQWSCEPTDEQPGCGEIIVWESRRWRGFEPEEVDSPTDALVDSMEEHAREGHPDDFETCDLEPCPTNRLGLANEYNLHYVEVLEPGHEPACALVRRHWPHDPSCSLNLPRFTPDVVEGDDPTVSHGTVEVPPEVLADPPERRSRRKKGVANGANALAGVAREGEPTGHLDDPPDSDGSPEDIDEPLRVVTDPDEAAAAVERLTRRGEG